MLQGLNNIRSSEWCWVYWWGNSLFNYQIAEGDLVMNHTYKIIYLYKKA